MLEAHKMVKVEDNNRKQFFVEVIYFKENFKYFIAKMKSNFKEMISIPEHAFFVFILILTLKSVTIYKNEAYNIMINMKSYK